MQTVTIELLSKEVLSILENLENLQLIRFLEPKAQEEPTPKSLSGLLSKESADLLRKHTEQIRDEWERDI